MGESLTSCRLRRNFGIFSGKRKSFTKIIQKMPSQRVYIGNLGSDVRERDVEKFFKGFGKLGEISIKNGYGFVDFDDYRDADDAVHDLDGKDIRGVRVRVELARERRDRDRGDRRGGRGGDRFGDRRGGGDRRDFGDRRGGGDRGGRPRGAPPGRKTEYRLIVENMSSKTSWQVNYGDPKWPAIPTFLQNLLQKFNHYYCNAGT